MRSISSGGGSRGSVDRGGRRDPGAAAMRTARPMLVLRQSLDADAAYADAALHGDGLTSPHYRGGKKAGRRARSSRTSRPHRIQIEKRGEYVFDRSSRARRPLQSAGGSFRLRLTEPFYVGWACAHDNNASEKAVFSNVEITAARADRREHAGDDRHRVEGPARRVHRAGNFEAPNWSRDGKYFSSIRAGGSIACR